MQRSLIDRWLFAAFFLLVFIGVIMVYSASVYYAEMTRHSALYYLLRHLLALLIGVILGVGFYSFPYRHLKTVAPVFLWAGLLLLVYLAFVARSRWVFLGPLHFQGVDVARFGLIIFLAASLSRKEDRLQDFHEGVFPHVVYLALFAGLTVLQPDFSSGMLILLIGFTMLFVAPVQIKHLAAVVGATIPLAVGVVLTSPYKLARVMALLKMEEDKLGTGYQVSRSLVSLGSGGLFGVGFTESKLKLFYLPEAHTDFIFSIIGEEWGLMGTLFVLALFFIIMVRGLRIANRATDRFAFYLSIGITANFIWYALINMMVTLRLAPPTGLPLPFISYGGTALIINCAFAGLLLGIHRQLEEVPAPRRKPVVRQTLPLNRKYATRRMYR
ncbi:MAG: cell division protein FtsW [Calditrichaeota bacterium]|nr:cell division protein FtsW [Calditrichota bacterium]